MNKITRKYQIHDIRSQLVAIHIQLSKIVLLHLFTCIESSTRISYDYAFTRIIFSISRISFFVYVLISLMILKKFHLWMIWIKTYPKLVMNEIRMNETNSCCLFFNFRTFFEKPHKNEYRHRRRCFTQCSHFYSTLSISFIRLYSLLTDTHERCLMYCIIWSFIALMYYWRILRIFSSALYPIVNLSPLLFLYV